MTCKIGACERPALAQVGRYRGLCAEHRVAHGVMYPNVFRDNPSVALAAAIQARQRVLNANARLRQAQDDLRSERIAQVEKPAPRHLRSV